MNTKAILSSRMTCFYLDFAGSKVTKADQGQIGAKMPIIAEHCQLPFYKNWEFILQCMPCFIMELAKS